jgi:hypothetical protein
MAEYGPEVREKVLQRLADGMTLRKACAEEGMPAPSSVCRWVLEDQTFAEQYARAREVGYQLMADGLVDIADDAQDPQKGRLQVDTRKWLLSKALPKIYGEKIVQEHTGPEGGPLEVKVTHEVVDPRADG